MMAGANTKLEWDFGVPEKAFWKDLQFTVARNFLTCYEPHELEGIDFNATLSVPDKLCFLLTELQTRISSAQHKPGSATWLRLMLGIETMQKQLGLKGEEAETIRTVLAATDGGARIPWLNMLAGLDMRSGNFAVAEKLAKEVLPWMQTHEKLGVDSPQAFGTTRTIIESLWRQSSNYEKKDEARRLVKETFELIDDMGGGKFVKYQDEERRLLQQVVEELGIEV